MRSITVLLAGAITGCSVVQPRDVLPSLAQRLADADTLRVVTLARGVQHAYVWYEQGPWAAHIVEVDQSVCHRAFEARKPGTNLAARAATSSLASDALAAINADFFRVPGGTPVGAHVTRGVPLIGPTDRQVVAFSRDVAWIGIARLDGFVAHRMDTVRVAQVNRAATPVSGYRGTTEGVTLFTAWIGDTVPADSVARRVRLRLFDGNEAAGRAIVIASDSTAAATRMDAGEAVLLAHGSARDWARRRSSGDTVSWRVTLPIPNRGPAQEVVGGFPELLRSGTDVLGAQTIAAGFGEQRHPRTAIGWTADQRRIFLVVVDGRQAPYSDGMSLTELAWLFRRIGASDALNLDGGGSSALVIRGQLINRPSDDAGERTVGNALALGESCVR